MDEIEINDYDNNGATANNNNEKDEEQDDQDDDRMSLSSLSSGHEQIIEDIQQDTLLFGDGCHVPSSSDVVRQQQRYTSNFIPGTTIPHPLSPRSLAMTTNQNHQQRHMSLPPPLPPPLPFHSHPLIPQFNSHPYMYPPTLPSTQLPPPPLPPPPPPPSSMHMPLSSNIAAGQQSASSDNVPLPTFPPGDYYNGNHHPADSISSSFDQNDYCWNNQDNNDQYAYGHYHHPNRPDAVPMPPDCDYDYSNYDVCNTPPIHSSMPPPPPDPSNNYYNYPPSYSMYSGCPGSASSSYYYSRFTFDPHAKTVRFVIRIYSWNIFIAHFYFYFYSDQSFNLSTADKVLYL